MAVKERKRGRPSKNKRHLSAELIVACARNLMQETKSVPSIRKVATELQVDTMAIYHYFSNKAALLEALTISLISDIYEPSKQARWQQEVKRLCKSYLELLNIHPGLLETLLSMQTVGPAQVFSERLNTALAPLELNNKDFIAARDLIADYIHGVALAMQSNPANLSVDCIDGPMRLVFNALEASITSRS